MDIQQFSNCDHSVWLSNRHKVITENFVPVEIRIEIFREVYDLIIEMGLRVWITGGTLLGAIREGAFIEYDDDIDMDMLEPDFIEAMYALKEKLMDLGYVVRLVDGKNPKMTFYKEGYKASIGALQIQGSWLTRPLRKYPLKTFEIDRFIEFYGVRCLMPNPPELYLEHVYGKQWTIPIQGDKDDTGKCAYISIRGFNFTNPTSYYLTIKIIIKRILNKL